MMINPHVIDFFGIVTAVTGIGGVLTAGRACQETLAVPQYGGGRSLLGAMTFIVLVDLFLVGMGVWIKLLNTTVAGGANG